MARPSKSGVARKTVTDHETRDQEVLRANKELAAYFKGRRTEREARAALKIIKAFVRDRERADPESRRPLPGTAPTPGKKQKRTRKVEARRGPAVRRKLRRQAKEKPLESRPDQTGPPPTRGSGSPDPSS